MNNRVKLNIYVDLFIGLMFIPAGISALVLFYVLPSGLRGSELFFSRHTWRDIHNYTGLLMIAGVVLHLILHANFIKYTLKNAWIGLLGRGK